MPSLQPPDADIDFESLPWNVNCSEKSHIVVCTTKKDWKEGEHYNVNYATAINQEVQCIKTTPYTGFPDIFPSCTSLNYGTTVWEGLKVFRTSKQRAVVFRPDKNYDRMSNGAQAMLLPVPPREMWFKQLQTVIRENSTLIPPCGEGMKLYVRPILFGSGQQLGLYPSPQFTLAMYVAPTGNYFKSATSGLKLHLEKHHARATRGGFGSVKCSGNYAVCLLPLSKTKEKGFSDNMYVELDSFHAGKEIHKHDTKTALLNSIVQEMSAANVFFVQKAKKRILTPSLKRKTILPGVTRDSVIQIVKAYNEEIAAALFTAPELDEIKEKEGGKFPVIEMLETDVQVADIADCSEAFGTGTAAELVPIKEFAEYLNSEDVEEGLSIATMSGSGRLRSFSICFWFCKMCWNQCTQGIISTSSAEASPSFLDSAAEKLTTVGIVLPNPDMLVYP
ncbi:unnamed protein product [Amoebophrya sp. A120]|nr:unnamed protein product [Amoebophrya sp. A120]|eukprot:GSA120T00009448001.1